MAKKYYQSARDRKDESRGMKRRLGEGKYTGYDSRRRQEYDDGMMISEDRSAIANMPQEVKYVQYPQDPYYVSPKLNDTMRGIDRQISDDVYSKSLKKKGDGYPEMF